MAFKGDLTNISLFDVFQTRNADQQTGVLVLQGVVTKKIFISPEGVRVFFTRSSRELRLGEIFVRRGRVSAQDVEILLMQQKQDYRPIGELLVESGKVTEEEIQHTLRYHAEDEIYEIFGWDSGSFSFFDGETDTEHGNTPLSDVLLDPGGLCLEAARRLDEMERLREVVPSDDDFYVQAEGVALDREKSSPSVRAVHEALAEPICVDELRDLVGMSQFNVLAAVAQLIEGGLARPLETAELIEEGRKARDLGDYARSAQLFGIAHGRDPGDDGVLEECVGVLERLDDPPRLAAMLAKLGAARSRAGDLETAVDQLEQALRHDPGNREALVALRDCFAALEDDERAAETSLRIARALAEDQDLGGAIDACRDGLEISPRAIALRYYYAQLLARTDEKVLAQAELRELVDATLVQKRALRNRKARELLSSCYRLLLRLDPEDDFAQSGLRELERQSGDKVRRRRLMMRGSIAAAALLIVAAAGIALMPDTPADMLARARELRDEGDTAGMEQILQQIIAEHPESPEAQQALGIGRELNAADLRKKQEALRAKQLRLKQEFQPRYEELLAELEGGDIQLAAGMLADVLLTLTGKRGDLENHERNFLKTEYAPELKLRVESFLERARETMEHDVRYVSTSEQTLRDVDKLTKSTLDVLVDRLTTIRQRDWPESALRIDAYLETAMKSGVLDSLERELTDFRKFFTSRGNSFSHLTEVYYHAKSLQLKENIRLAMSDARKQGRELLARCEFEKARAYYKTVLDYAQSARNAEVREHFKEVLAWIVSLNIERSARTAIEDIDEVTRSLTEIEALKDAGREDVAYVRMRSLIKEHRLIQFERRYNLPYRVVSRPSGAGVLVNGKPVGRTPCAIELDIVEKTEVRVEAPGFEPVEKRLEIADPALDGLLDVSMRKIRDWEQSLRGSPEARPVMAGSLVLVPTNEASLLALRVGDGGREWEAETGLLDRIKATPLTDVKHAHFVTIGGRYFAVSLASGDVAQSLTLPGEVKHDGVLILGTVYYATRNRKLVAIRDGRVIFEESIAFDPVTALHAVGDELAFGTADGYVLFHSLADGKEVRRLQSSDRSSFFGGVARFGDQVVGAAEDGYVYGFDPKKTEPLWRFRLTGSLAAAPLAANGALLLPSTEGFLWMLDATGRRTGRVDVRKSFNGAPVLHHGFLYIAAGPRIIAYDLENKSTWWEVEFEDEQPMHVAAGDRAVVVVTNRGRVVAYAADKRGTGNPSD